MTRLLIVSDTHGEVIRLSDLMKKYEGRYDVLVHLGDRVMDFFAVSEIPPASVVVKGNMETAGPGSESPNDWIGEWDGVKVLATHGHRYSVHSTMVFLMREAKRLDSALVLFGHTHERFDETRDSIRYFNPGAFKSGDYGYAVLDKGNILEICHDRLTDIKDGE